MQNMAWKQYEVTIYKYIDSPNFYIWHPNKINGYLSHKNPAYGNL